MRKGAVQLYYLGWNVDYLDPENFLFLLAGAEGKGPQVTTPEVEPPGRAEPGRAFPD